MMKSTEEIKSILEAYANDIHELVEHRSDVSVIYLYGDDKTYLASSLVSGTVGSVSALLRALCAKDKNIAAAVVRVAADVLIEQVNESRND